MTEPNTTGDAPVARPARARSESQVVRELLPGINAPHVHTDHAKPIEPDEEAATAQPIIT